LERFPVLLGNKCGTPGQGGEKCEKQCCAAQEQEEFCENRPACNDACEAQCLIDRGWKGKLLEGEIQQVLNGNSVGFVFVSTALCFCCVVQNYEYC